MVVPVYARPADLLPCGELAGEALHLLVEHLVGRRQVRHIKLKSPVVGLRQLQLGHDLTAERDLQRITWLPFQLFQVGGLGLGHDGQVILVDGLVVSLTYDGGYEVSAQRAAHAALDQTHRRLAATEPGQLHLCL